MSASDESPQAGVTQQVLDTYRGTVSGPVSPYQWCLMTHVSTVVSTSAVTMCHQHQCQCQCGPSWDLMLIMSAWCSARTHNLSQFRVSKYGRWLVVAGESEVIAWPRLSSSPSRGHSGHLGPVQLARRHTETGNCAVSCLL